MNIKELKVNHFIKIKGRKYEVIGVMEDFVCESPEYELRKTIYFDLLEQGSKRITPTHGMVYYLDTKEISFSSHNVLERGGLKLKENEVGIIS